MYEVYSAMASAIRPPFLDDVFMEETRNEALLQLEKSHSWNTNEWERLNHQVWENDENAKMEVLHLHRIEYEDVVDNIFHFMNQNRLSFLVRSSLEVTPRNASLYYAPIQEIW